MSGKTKTAFGVLGVLIGGVALFFSLTRPPNSQPQAAAEATGIVMRGYDRDGGLTWEAKASRGEIVDQEGTLIDVVAEFFDGSGSPIRVRAARLVRSGRTATLDGGVIIVRDDGLHMETQHVSWDEDARTLRSGSTTLSYKGSLIHGEQLEYDLRAKRAAISSVTATLEQDTTFRVTGARADLTDDRFVLEGSVQAESESEIFTCKRLEATLDGESLTLLGGVAAAGSGFEANADVIEIRPEGRWLHGNVSGDVILTGLGGERGA